MKMDISLIENATNIKKIGLFIILIVCQITVVLKLHSLNYLLVEKSNLVESKGNFQLFQLLGSITKKLNLSR